MRQGDQKPQHKYIRREGPPGNYKYFYGHEKVRVKQTEEAPVKKVREVYINVGKEAMKIIQTLKNNGHEAFLTGGAVRDSLLGKKAHDFDIVTSAKPDEINKLFSLKGSVGSNFAVHIVEGHEVASYRKDWYPETGSAKDAQITLASSVDEDIRRRDFTINSFVYDPDSKQVFDFVGGLKDLEDGVVRFIGDPDKRIKEDSVRMLRAIRFANRFGFEIDLNSFKAIQKHMHKMKDIPGERIQLELMKMLEADSIIGGLYLMLTTGFFKEIIPELYAGFENEQNKYHAESILMHNMLAADAIKKKDPILRLAALLHDVGKVQTKQWSEDKKDYQFLGHESVGARIAEKIMKRLKFSSEDTARVKNLIEKHMYFFTEETKDKTIKKFMTDPDLRNILRLRIADRRANLAKKNKSPIPFSLKKLIKKIRLIERTKQPLTVRDLAVNGHDLMKLGLKPGPLFGKLLNNALELVLESPESNKKELLIEFVKKEISNEK